jgi:outer membrane protein assembly factor BamA
MRLAVLVLLGLTLAACSRSQPRQPRDEYLKAIRFEGNQKLKSKTLVAGLALRRTQARRRPPDPYLVQVDADRIRGEYLRKGYLAVDVRSRVEREGDASVVTYTVEEGVRAKTRVVINGIPDDADLAVAKIREQLPLRDGAAFDYAVYERAKQSLIGIVKDAGYAHAKLDATVYADRANHEAIIQLDYNLGPKATFGSVEITGVTGDLADAVRDRLQFEQGDRYSTKAITATQRALYGLARFSTVQVQPDEEVSPVVGVKVAVTESARREVKLGGGFGIDPTAYEVRGRAGYTIVGWPFAMDTLTLNFRPAYALLRDGGGYQPRIRARGVLERQDLLWTYSKGDIEAGYNYLAVEAYTSYGPIAGLGFSTPLKSQRYQLRLGWTLERLQFRDISPLIDSALQTRLGLDEAQRVGAYTQALVIDLRDHPIDTRLGAYGEVHVAEGTTAAGGNFDYLQIVPDLRGFVPIGPVVLAARVRAGVIYGDVAVTHRMFSGGASSHRGFGERKLAPFVAGDVEGDFRVIPYGGAALLETGIEARVPITTWRKLGFGAVVFLDGGDVVEDESELDPFDLHWAAGFGLRVKTIVGPVRADFGYRLNRTGPMEPAPDSSYAFHLSLGEAF